MIACSEYSQVYLVFCVCALVFSDFNADPLLAFRHLVFTARLSGCEPQRMRLLTLKFQTVCRQLHEARSILCRKS